MRPTRRDMLAGGAALLGTTSLAGCNGLLGDGSADAADGSTQAAATTDDGSSSQGQTLGPGVAVAAEWNAMRARVWDAVSLGLAGAPGAGATVVEDTFARFENAGGEYGAHETLERTNETNYESFEAALGELRTAGLDAGNLERAREEGGIADQHLSEAQQSLVGESTAQALDLQVLGATAQNAAALASAGAVEAAGEIAGLLQDRFEAAAVHDAVESADSEAYQQFESGLEGIATAADNGDAAGVQSSASDAYAAALAGSYALANAEHAAGAGHIAALQARGWDAAAIASMGGPSTAYAHAAGLTIYRARVHDARWLAAAGKTGRAATMVSDVFAHFEGARAHEALEEADGEAYEGFEGGLSDLQSAIENGDAGAMDEGLDAVDSNLVTGIEALAGSNAPLLEAAFFRARIADARERYRRGETDVAAGIAEDLFARFEANELDFHETVEETSEDLYHAFEEEHLAGIVDAFGNGNDEAVATHYDGIHSTLLDFETQAGGTATVSGAEGAYMAARGFDAAVLDTLGNDGRAKAIAQSVFEHFEGGAGGYHEALEEADHELYETFESRLGAVSTAAGDGADVYAPAKEYNASALESVYAIVESGGGGGSTGGAAGSVAQAIFADFEEARVHELLEKADHSAYETFEGQLEALITAAQDGGDVSGAAAGFADACLWAQFALVDSVEELPISLELPGSGGEGGEGHGGGGGGNAELSGGPNVVEGVPADADHVIDMTSVAFEPAELTVSAGDKVAWTHAGGEPHSVTATESELPSGATYWASGGFESEKAARSGWENGKGAVQSGHSYVHTFETTGTHPYVCIPHEAAGMTGTITVE